MHASNFFILNESDHSICYIIEHVISYYMKFLHKILKTLIEHGHTEYAFLQDTIVMVMEVPFIALSILVLVLSWFCLKIWLDTRIKPTSLFMRNFAPKFCMQ